jgi:acid phosphatase (class A)
VRATIYQFADAIGNPVAFNPQALPKFDSLFRKVLYEEGAVVQAGKRSFKRPRPFVLEPRIEPIVDKPSNDSYPSGHTLWARTVGIGRRSWPARMSTRSTAWLPACTIPAM